MKKEIFYCDICKAQAPVKKSEIQVIFTTEQTEGRSCEPYLSKQIFEICEFCYKKVLEGNYIWAHGAQGHNTYYFKDK